MKAKQAVIVINSQVARGSVGGRAGVFVLQRMGFPAWWVPTVQFPWHPGHSPSTRMAPEPAVFKAYLADLAVAPWLGEVAAVISGYLGEAGQAGPIGELVDAVKAKNPDATYLCDPIIGDAGGLFQPEDVGVAIREVLLPRADMATPNRFELAWFSGKSLEVNDELIEAARQTGVREMVVTSAFAGDGAIGNLLVQPESVSLFSHMAYPSVPHGSGDLLAALYLGNRLNRLAPAAAIERAAASTHDLITLGRAMGDDEMPLVAGQALFESPPDGVTVETLGGSSHMLSQSRSG